MTRKRLQTFNDVVIAILIIIMVLELRPPHGTGLTDLQPLLPAFLIYLLSFVYVSIYWYNHEMLYFATGPIPAKIVGANMHLLFWLSLIPFVTAWAGSSPSEPLPTALYGGVLLSAALACYLLNRVLEGHRAIAAALPTAVLSKDKVSILLYVMAFLLAFVNTLGSYALYLVVALMWLAPERRINGAENETIENESDGAAGRFDG